MVSICVFVLLVVFADALRPPCPPLPGAATEYHRYCGNPVPAVFNKYVVTSYRLNYVDAQYYYLQTGVYQSLVGTTCLKDPNHPTFALPILSLSDHCFYSVPANATCSRSICLSDHSIVLGSLRICYSFSGYRNVSKTHFPLSGTLDSAYSFFCDHSTGKYFTAHVSIYSAAVLPLFMLHNNEVHLSYIGRLLTYRVLPLVYRPTIDIRVACGRSTGHFFTVYLVKEQPCNITPDTVLPPYMCPFGGVCHRSHPIPTTLFPAVPLYHWTRHERRRLRPPVIIPPSPECPVASCPVCPACPTPSVAIGTQCPAVSFPENLSISLDHGSTLEILDEATKYFFFMLTGQHEALVVASPQRQRRFFLDWFSKALSAMWKPVTYELGQILKPIETAIKEALKVLLEIVRPLVMIVIETLLELEEILVMIMTEFAKNFDLIVKFFVTIGELLYRVLTTILLQLDTKILFFEYCVLFIILYFYWRDLIITAACVFVFFLFLGLTRPYPSVLPFLLSFKERFSLNFTVSLVNGTWYSNATHHILVTDRSNHVMPKINVSEIFGNFSSIFEVNETHIRAALRDL